ncbi:Acyl-protein synthetase, LuxE [Aquimarina amphilecti]|uniref:Acyl-protein synthetase, LuxE n=1 Tax=Aquimarina amphilecti TaxID=1038014 RepID=A0A1H7L086_AQUAM|nr:acyl transferase [Aquimarina amphilecti]SEK92402.1 Acyl-protein synthetase, LuxE [Aquimarina amphilecti]
MLSETIFTIQNNTDFEKMAIRVFQHQYINCKVYQRFCNLLGVTKSAVTKIKEIPFLPVQFFKQEKIVSSSSNIQQVFTSSGTTGSITSKHYITNLDIYENSFFKGFQHFYGNIEDYTILALLPSYLERENSSLVYMADKLIKDSKQSNSGFYLDETTKLIETLKHLTKERKKIILIGVSFALLDLIENNSIQLNKDTIVMETGGMKGRRKEIIREELHQILKKGFGISEIHSEYGMTELLSQAYSKGNGIFYCPPWMKISTRDTEDALTYLETNKTGGINIIDLANINSCSFIATQDLGKTYDDGSFEILGRFDNSDIRGCNLMAL